MSLKYYISMFSNKNALAYYSRVLRPTGQKSIRLFAEACLFSNLTVLSFFLSFSSVFSLSLSLSLFSLSLSLSLFSFFLSLMSSVVISLFLFLFCILSISFSSFFSLLFLPFFLLSLSHFGAGVFPRRLLPRATYPRKCVHRIAILD
jgi:hypothetical protein